MPSHERKSCRDSGSRVEEDGVEHGVACARAVLRLRDDSGEIKRKVAVAKRLAAQGPCQY